MSKFLLTIAIPTYNRPVQLAHTLSIIVPQVLSHANVQLLILDNCSPVPAADVLSGVMKSASPCGQIKVIRHSTNIGGNGNILRCFDMAEGEWIWCLGDDDDPAADAVETILTDCQRHPHCYAYYGLGEGVPRLDDCGGLFLGSSITEWVRRIPKYGHRLFLSESVFKIDAIRPYFPMAYDVVSSGAAHLVMAFMAIENGGSYLLSSKQIARYNQPPAGTGYNCVPLAYGSATLFSMIGPKCSYTDFKMFFQTSFAEWVSPFLFLRQAIILHRTLPASRLHANFKIIVNLFKPMFMCNPRSWIRWTLADFMSIVPWLFTAAFSLRARLAHRRVSEVDGRVI